MAVFGSSQFDVVDAVALRLSGLVLVICIINQQ